MIGWLKGRLLEVSGSEAILDVNGVGYALQIGPNKLFQLRTAQNTELEFYVYTLMREDSLRLFGFDSLKKRELFVTLLSVSGVGPKAAVAILDLFEPEPLIASVQAGDERAFQQVPGIGKKTAQRIILDLKGKFKDFSVSGVLETPVSSDPDQSRRVMLLEARSALMNLGFMEREADTVISRHLDLKVGLDELIRLCLQELQKN